MNVLAVTVHGIPIPQGSMKAFVRGRNAVITHSNPRLRSWREDVASVLADARVEQFTGAVSIAEHFRLARPASHFGKRGLLPSAPPFPIGARDDLDKLVRAIHDAVTASGVWRDDGQVVRIITTKDWCNPGEGPGVDIIVRDVER